MKNHTSSRCIDIVIDIMKAIDIWERERVGGIDFLRTPWAAESFTKKINRYSTFKVVEKRVIIGSRFDEKSFHMLHLTGIDLYCYIGPTVMPLITRNNGRLFLQG